MLLEAGFGADSGAWYKVRPALAKSTRVCAYDRAGAGYSDPGPLPRDGGAIARDLDQALAAAKMDGPFIVVGHSAGGLYARLFAARRPNDVVGLVLLDPTVERRAPRPSGDGLDGLRNRARRCLTAAESTPQPALKGSEWSGCLPEHPTARQVENATRAATWQGQLSELDSLFGRTSEQVTMTVRVLKAVPVYVITASATASTSPVVGFNPPRPVWEVMHQRLASFSDDGSQTTVFSSHMIMIDRPEVVVAAVDAMLTALRRKEPVPPLPASESIPESDTGDPPDGAKPNTDRPSADLERLLGSP